MAGLTPARPAPRGMRVWLRAFVGFYPPDDSTALTVMGRPRPEIPPPGYVGWPLWYQEDEPDATVRQRVIRLRSRSHHALLGDDAGLRLGLHALPG